ncbi:amino acid ABC transporter substrate-binding protein [Burkholderia ubonensis]|uniref:ABC transporter substrate-binding protein n=2 Tax=Burkholderia ubonensis TaxID=101571 RepID=UPI000BA69B93|nr:ABC transporter substrate-binding protein [Burkholderia ubonensis]PAK13264.1 amino acid ABC transporter substrate-binding protein [Burkholderia ubonensis]RQP27162.1 amino acid ABC transporter substrate-binding protein [Burkholderia ubonensis]RQP29872.1 amino acid ABC transporter substrate-binding protein [Burkholderia ubonensis]RQP30918.1 amino acid ABC transporter substrate-binding protein [Burkholderia ubonensis]RQP48461.1 amino acid ABC transporter substrate-binding protein [Burkholderia
MSASAFSAWLFSVRASWRGTLLVACLVTISAPAACFAAEPGMTDGAIRLGMVNAQTGGAGGLGRGLRIGAEAVFDDANARGGVHGRKIELVVADDRYEPDRTIDSTLEMIEQRHVFALFGYLGTPTTTAVLPIIKDTGIPLVGALTGAMALRKPVIPEVFNIRASYEDETRALVDHFIAHDGARRFAVFYQDDGFGLALLAGTRHALQRHGLDVVASGTFRRGTMAVDTGLASVLEGRPDVVIMGGPYAPVAAFMRDARREGLKARLAAVSFVDTDDLLRLVGADGDGLLISQVVPLPQSDRNVIRDCTRLIERYFPEERAGVASLEGCIDAKIMLIGLERAGPSPTRAALIQALESIRHLDLGGLVADLGTDNHQALNAVFLTEIAHGQVTPLDAPAR